MSESDQGFCWWGAEALDRRRWGALVEPVLGRILVALERGRLPHAMLLIGPPGLGRELAAVEAAALLVCDADSGPWTASPCADRVRRGIHPDVVAMLPDGPRGVIRIGPVREQVVEVVGGRPYEGRRRVWIFDGVEEEGFPRASANAFLKTLEEPPQHAVFLLLAANPAAVLPTIRSRCQQLTLPGVLAVAAGLGAEAAVPELAHSTFAGEDVDGAAGVARTALGAALDGECGEMLQLPWAVPEGVPLFGLMAAVALEMAREHEESTTRGEALARLASELLGTERRSRALNLNIRNQLLSCLMRWYREL